MLLVLFFLKQNNVQDTPYSTVVFANVEQGFGYAIYNGDKKIIFQPYIPSVDGTLGFQTVNEAKKVASLVISKLEKGKSPVITKNELAALNIIRK